MANLPDALSPSAGLIGRFKELIRARRLGLQQYIPPAKLRYVGASDFLDTGVEFLELFKNIGGLKPNDRVLDVGCGSGRMALPLLNYLSDQGSYEGFDPVSAGIKWCSKRIAPHYPRFMFHHSDVLNEHYNPEGAVSAAEYRFPFEDESFDFVFLTSVFTHMLRADLENYADEVARVLKPGGTSFITYFILTPDALALIDAGKSDLAFPFTVKDTRVDVEDRPEAAVAFEPEYIENLYSRLGLTLRNEPYPGSWCGREEFLSYQDIVVASK